MSSKEFRCRGLVGTACIAVALLAAITVSWAAGTSLTGAGATFPYPLYSKWFDVYQKEHGVAISYQSIGSGGGIQQLKSGTVDFGASDAPLSDQEMKEMPAAVVHVPMVAGAVAIAYNLPGVQKGLRLSGDVLADIFLGSIRQWNDKRIVSLNPRAKLPNLPIAVAHRSDGSGTSYIFTGYLSAVSETWHTKVGTGKSVNWPVGIGGKGNDGVAGVIKQTPGGLGYVELAYALQNKLPYAYMRNRADQFVEPTIATTTAAAAGSVKAMQKDVRVSIVNAPGKSAYPIAGFTYILVYQKQTDAAKGRALADFLQWAATEGQKYAAPLEYAPLPREIVTLDGAKIKSLAF
jgi:phosphate transport system substrate-binding protein